MSNILAGAAKLQCCGLTLKDTETACSECGRSRADLEQAREAVALEPPPPPQRAELEVPRNLLVLRDMDEPTRSAPRRRQPSTDTPAAPASKRSKSEVAESKPTSGLRGGSASTAPAVETAKDEGASAHLAPAFTGDPETQDAYAAIVGLSPGAAAPELPPDAAGPPDWDSPPEDTPTESVAEDAPDLVEKKVRLRWEPVNVRLVAEALKLDAVRRVPLNHYSAFDVLLSVQRRAVNVKGKVGWIAVVEREAEAVDGKPQRLYSGIQGLDAEDIPPAVIRELKQGVPGDLAGVSAFHFSRALKYLIRGGLGMVEYDAANAFFEVLKLLLPELPEAIAQYCEDRERILEQIVCFFRQLTAATASGPMAFSRDDAKQLLLSIGFGGSLHGWCCSRFRGEFYNLSGDCADFLGRFEREMRQVRTELRRRFPSTYNAVAKRPYPEASLTSVLYMWKERTELTDPLRQLAGAAASPEHDGVGAKAGLLQQLQARVRLPLATKPYPEPFERLMQKAPHMDWSRPAGASVEEYADVLDKCRMYVATEAKVVRANAMTFARYVAMRMRATTNVPHADGERRTHFEVFSEERGLWMVRHRDDLASVIAEALADIVRPSARPRWARGPLPDPPPPLNDGKFAASLCELVLGLLSKDLPMPALDGDHSRGKLLFRCGTVLDFESNTTRKATPEDRLGHCMGCDFNEYAPPEGAAAVFHDILRWIAVGSAALKESDAGQRVQDHLSQLGRDVKVLTSLHDFAGSWEAVIWLLRTVARMATGNPRICEFLYLYGPGSSGKDVAMLIVLAFFGGNVENYGCVLNGNFLVESGKSCKEAASPFAASTIGKRFVWASEVPKHENLQVEFMKQFSEQSGAPMTARKLYKGPTSFRPIGVICATSNFPPQVKHKDDTGYIRRARVWQTSQTFCTQPRLLTQKRADPTIKQQIAAGAFNAELLWLVRGLALTLTASVNPATELEPRPVFMREVEEECLEGSSKEQFLEFISEHTEPCDRKSATKVKIFKQAVSDFLNVPKPTVATIMTDCGYAPAGVSNGADKVVVGHHPARSGRGDGLRLKSK